MQSWVKLSGKLSPLSQTKVRGIYVSIALAFALLAADGTKLV
jgi:hypothetical protein